MWRSTYHSFIEFLLDVLREYLRKSVRLDNIIFLQKVSDTKPADQSTTYALGSCYLAGVEYPRKRQVLSGKKRNTD